MAHLSLVFNDVALDGHRAITVRGRPLEGDGCSRSLCSILQHRLGGLVDAFLQLEEKEFELKLLFRFNRSIYEPP